MTALAAEPVLAGFHRLRVSAIEDLTEDAVALRLAVPAELAATYAFRPGQHVAVRIPGDEVRRSYSICSLPGEPGLRIGVRRLPGGRFSHGVLDTLRVGDELDVMTPAGRFGAALPQARRPAFLAAGSGITPILSMVAAALADPLVEQVAVIASNRGHGSVMFADELAGLKDEHPGRLQLVHLLTREEQESPLLSGRLDAGRFRALRDALLAPADAWFLCGPQQLVLEIRAALLADGLKAGAVHTELFHVDTVPAVRTETRGTGTRAEVRLAGRTGEVEVGPGEVVLDAVLRARPEAPYACKGGVCGTCRAKVLEGAVTMDANWALEPEEQQAGYVLTCQSHPSTERLVLDYDA
jgi:ring-1,2-phenylacetyl-CoA epoxidase subunit PaaE